MSEEEEPDVAASGSEYKDGSNDGKYTLMPLDPVAHVTAFEAFQLPEIDDNLYVGSAEVGKTLPFRWTHPPLSLFLLHSFTPMSCNNLPSLRQQNAYRGYDLRV